MKLLTRYIARLYLINVVTLFVLLFLFVVTVDVVINLGRFTKTAAEMMATAESNDPSLLHRILFTAMLIIDLWSPRLLQLFNYLTGPVLIVAMGFTCTQLVRHREFVAILAGGVSLFRLVIPFFIVALVLTSVQVINQEIFVPSVAHLLTRDAGDSGKRDVSSFRVRLAPDAQGRLFYAATFDDETKTLKNVRIWDRDPSGQVQRVISASSATWDADGWQLTDGRAEIVPPPGSADPVRVEPIERLDSSLDPTRLKVRYLAGFGQSLSWRQITNMIETESVDEKERQRLERLRWGRIAGLFSNLVTLAIALPFFLVRQPQPMIIPALKSAPVVLAGLAAAAAGSTLALPGLPIWLGTFVPGLILVPIAIALYTGMRT